MSKIGDICDVCGRVIQSYPIYGKGTCRICHYEKFLAKLKKNIDDFFQKRINEGYEVTDIDYLLLELVESMPKMTERDVLVVQHMINKIKERD